MIEKDRVQHFPSRFGQTKGHVAYAKDGLDIRNLLFDQAHAFDGFDSAAHVISVAGRAGKNERVDDDIFGANAVVVIEQLDRALRDLELALSSDCLGLFLVFIDAADDQSCAILAGERRDSLEFIEAVLQVDRVDDRFALAIGERALDRDRIGGVDHGRGLDHSNHLFVETIDVIKLLAIGVLEIDVADLRTPLNLLPGDLGCLFVFLFGDQALEFTRADFVGSLANDQRALVIARFDKVDSRKQTAMMFDRDTRSCIVDHLRKRAYVGRGRAAAASDQIDPAVIDKARKRGRHALGSFEVYAVFVGQPGVGYAGNASLSQLSETAYAIGHELGSSCAVQTD